MFVRCWAAFAAGVFLELTTAGCLFLAVFALMTGLAARAVLVLEVDCVEVPAFILLCTTSRCFWEALRWVGCTKAASKKQSRLIAVTCRTRIIAGKV